jgi:hypothetical protein
MSNLIFSNNGMLFFQQNIRYMFLFVQVLSTLTMEFHSKNLYTCREPIVLVRCIFWKFIILILYIFFFEIIKVNISLKLQCLLFMQAKRVLT